LASDVVVQGGNAGLSIVQATQLKLVPELGYPTGGGWYLDISVARNRVPLTIPLTVYGTSNRASTAFSLLELYNNTGGNLSLTWSQFGVWKTNGALPSVINPYQTMQFLFQCWGNNESDISVQYLNQSNFGYFSVLNFGAKGDGSTNDRNAIIAANAAATAANGILTFPPGNYYVSPGLTITAACQFDGGALTIPAFQNISFSREINAPLQRLFYGSGTVRMTFRGAKCPVEWWGAGTGSESVQVDDTAYIQAAFDACRNYGGDIFAEVVFSRQYWLSDEVVVNSNVGISTNSASASMSKTSAGSGKGMRFQGAFDANRIWTLPNFTGFSVFAIKVDKVSTARFYIGLISGDSNGDGIAVGCNDLGTSTLDNTFHVNYIAYCKSAIRIYSNANTEHAPLCTIEGNEFNVNFINQCQNGVVYDSLDNYTLPNSGYTIGSAWDCNIFNITALDAGPGYKRGFWYRATGLQYSQTVFRVPAWFGGFDAGTGIWIDTQDGNGNYGVTKSTFEIGVRTGENMDSYDQFRLRGSNNAIVINGSGEPYGSELGMAVYDARTGSNERAYFNGGTPVPRNRMRVNCALPGNANNGDVIPFYIYSPLIDGRSNRLRVSFVQANGFILEKIVDNSLSISNEILIQLRNVSGSTVYSGTVIELWVEIAY
jgi:hypothetical protein